ncbi:MAG TPA: carboxypeptidase-like regulatory domain-containing protein [Candidatus Acidoferrales bacterium]|nr:carboxypeptidase-like regulatory domain-containing protein [Candidatus Acidoferrales bacterium]
MRIVAGCLFVVVGSALAGLWGVAAARAQSSIAGTIVGTVKDTSGAVIPGASVDVLSVATGTTFSTTTGTDGRYTLANARPGQYTIQVTAKGFRPYKQESVIVEAGRSTSLDITLLVLGQAPPVVTVRRPDLSTNVISVPRVQSPPSIDCSSGNWDNAMNIELSQANGIVARLYPSPASELPSPPEEVRAKLSAYRATYQLEWDATDLYMRVRIHERQIDVGHPSFPQEDALKTGGANLFLPDMLYDTAVLQLLAPSLYHYVTEMHIYVRPPGARPPQWTFAGRDNNEEDFHVLEGKAVSCPRPDGYLVKAAVAWLPFPPEWRPAPGAQAGLRLFAPLPYNQGLSLEDRSRKVFVLVRVVEIALRE